MFILVTKKGKLTKIPRKLNAGMESRAFELALLPATLPGDWMVPHMIHRVAQGLHIAPYIVLEVQ